MKQLKDPGWGMSSNQLDDFYLRWREMMKAVNTHKGVLVANPRHAGFFRDMIERLREDPFWYLTMPNADEAGMMFRNSVPYDDLLIWTPQRRTQLETPTEFFGRAGFGRMAFKAPTREGVRPWETAVPDKDAKPLRPDSAEDTPSHRPDS